MAGKASSTGFAGIFAQVAQHYEKRHGPVSDALGLIAAKNHRNGVHNPYAQLRKDLGEEFCQTVSEKNPMVAEPLRRTDCSPVSDGAAAVVLSTTPGTRGGHEPRPTGRVRARQRLPALRQARPAGVRRERAALAAAMTMAGAGLDDLDLVEVHDCFTIAELVLYEVMGLARRGEGRRAIEEGWVCRDGRLPVNLSGGLKAKGHPVGATGVSQHVLAAMQLSGTAGAMQLPGARRAAVHNMGGLGVANYVSVLEAC